MNLINISTEFNSDKQWRHKYFNIYEQYFNPYKNQNIKLFEIGILNGESLRIWEKYFNNEKSIFYGVDIDMNQISGTFNDRVIIEKVNQRNREEVITFAEKYGKFDIIIDDGDHQPLSQQMCFGILFKYLNPKGIYVIEDLHTSYNIGRLQLDKTQISTIDILMILKNKLQITSDFMKQEEIDFVVNNYEYCDIKRYDVEKNEIVDSVMFGNKTPSEIAFIKKK